MKLITGVAGFVGFHTAMDCLARGEKVAGIDNLNDYYDVGLKQSRLNILRKQDGFVFHEIDIADYDAVWKSISGVVNEITHIIHLAAQAGVRHSIKHPFVYAHSNLNGHLSLMEVARNLPHLEHFVYASSSSVYGNNEGVSSIDSATNEPVSLYAATKKAGELMAHSYASLYGISSTGLRFFTVYGPYGRPDMAYFSFTKNIFEGKPITLFNNGDMRRDFTYIDDIVDGIRGVLSHPPGREGDFEFCGKAVPHRVFNLGHNQPETLMDFVTILEDCIGKKAEKIMAPMADGDVYETYADISLSKDVFEFSPQTSLRDGLSLFVEWYKKYYGV